MSWDAIARRHADAVEAAEGSSGAPQPTAPKPAGVSACITNPDATLAANSKAHRSEPSYKQHTAADAERGVTLDVAVTTGAAHDTRAVKERLGAVAAVTGRDIRVATMDASYAITRVFADLEERRIEAAVPVKAERPPKKGAIPVRRSEPDARNGVVRCPGGDLLRPHGKPDSDGFQHHRARIPDGQACRLLASCFSPAIERRAILLHMDHPALLRSRRKHARRGERERGLHRSHRIRVEGVHGEAKTWHGRARAVRRGLTNMRIQAHLTAATVNLKRLVAAVLALPLPAKAGFSLASPVRLPDRRRPSAGPLGIAHSAPRAGRTSAPQSGAVRGVLKQA